MWALILKLSKSVYNETDLLFHVHKSWLSTSLYDHQVDRFIAESNFQWWPQAETPLDALDPG